MLIELFYNNKANVIFFFGRMAYFKSMLNTCEIQCSEARSQDYKWNFQLFSDFISIFLPGQ